MLGSYDRFITSMHRFTSTNFLAKWIFTISQYGLLEDFVTAIYRWILVATGNQLYNQFRDLIKRRKDVDEIWVVATHFGMAHQIGAIKERLIRDTGVKIRLVVQVTDDTSQHIWCVRGADLTFISSQNKKEGLLSYARKKKMNLSLAVIPYPLSPTFTTKIEAGKEKRQKAFESNQDVINVAVPISGAAVGLSFTTSLIKMLSKKSSRFHFFVLTKKSVYTEVFLSNLAKVPNLQLITGKNDNEMIGLYEKLYRDNLIHLEITKPSEQAFKAILPPSEVGGSLMLFTAPVGRQEYENLSFLKKHHLMAGNNNLIPRGIKLPKEPTMAADFVLWALESGLFLKMSQHNFKFSQESLASGEVGSDGASLFWKTVESRFG